jgi:Na+/melibiose symporter-like transporter
MRNIFLTQASPSLFTLKMVQTRSAIVLVSLLYMNILLVFHPSKRQDDYNFVLVSNFLLICCFVMYMILKLCSEQANVDTGNEKNLCKRFIGRSFDSYIASLMVVCLPLGMAIISIFSIFAVRNMLTPSVYKRCTKFGTSK